mmetsp:Transcript_42104/g.62922  ORF Transcript_42104/g.62922 Transcript_42104/m.62922 type:complete len:113 (-) Transcript_42104:112-450(-)
MQQQKAATTAKGAAAAAAAAKGLANSKQAGSTSLSTAWKVSGDTGSIAVALPRARSVEDYVFETSESDGVRVLDRGHTALLIDWPFQVDPDTVRARRSRKHHRITVDVAKRH